MYGGIGLFLPLIRRDIGISFSQAGAIAGASIAVYALMQIPGGYLADRFGAKRVFVIGLLGVTVTAFDLASLHQFPIILLNQAASGFFRALVFAPGLLLITAVFSPQRRATAMGLYVAGGFSSNIFLNALGPLLVGPLGWRGLFIVFSTAGLIILGLYNYVGAAGPATSGAIQRPIAEMLSLLGNRSLWIIGAIQFVRLAVVSGFAFWLPTLLVVEKGQQLQVAGLAIALAAALGAPANIFGGYLSDRLRNPLLVVAVSLIALAATTYSLVAAHNTLWLFGLIALNGIFAQFCFGPLFSLPVDLFGPRLAGLTTGFGNLCANLGGLTFALILGVVKDLTGSFSIGLFALAGLCVVGLICVALLARTGVSVLGSA